MKRLLFSCCLYAMMCNTAWAHTWYVLGGGNPAGNGSQSQPFNSLHQVENASSPGDTIFVLPSQVALDGGIQLKDDQKLVGLGPEVTKAPSTTAHARATNSTGQRYNGDAIRLAHNTTVTNIHVAGAFRSGILGINVTSPTIRDNLITENLIQNNDLHVIQNNYVIFQPQRNHFGAITLFACGAAPASLCLQQDPTTVGIANTGEVIISGNEIRDSNVEGMIILNDTAVVATYQVKDNSVHDISLTLPAPESVGITEVVRSRGFTLIAGNGSLVTVNMDAMEASNMAPAGNFASDGVVFVTFGTNALITADISDLVISNPFLTGELINGDSLELTHFGSNSTFDVRVQRAQLSDSVNTRVKLLEVGDTTQNSFYVEIADSQLTNTNLRSALPQARGAIGYAKLGNTQPVTLKALDLTVRRTTISGIGRGMHILNTVPANTVNIFVEKSSLSDLTKEGFFFSNTSTINSANIDLGGGLLGSAGENSLTNNGSFDVSVTNTSATPIDVFASKNFWGGAAPVIGADVQLVGPVHFIAPTFLTSNPHP